MRGTYKEAMELAVNTAELSGAHKALKAENERLHERVKDLERQLADAYARIAEMANGPTITTETEWPPDGIYITTCGPMDAIDTSTADLTPTTSVQP